MGFEPQPAGRGPLPCNKNRKVVAVSQLDFGYLCRDRGFAWYRRLIFGVVGALILGAGCGDAPADIDWGPDGLQVLVLGNSIMAWHDTPTILNALADSAGITNTNIVSYTVGGWSLRDHWQYPRVRQILNQGDWDVILLQGARGVGETRDSLLKYTELIHEEVTELGAELALFMRWPPRGEPELYDEMTESYRIAAERVDGLQIPAGAIWMEVDALHPSIPLYDDHIHPTQTGAYLSALVMFQSLTGRSPIGLPSSVEVQNIWGRFLIDVPQQTAETLQEMVSNYRE